MKFTLIYDGDLPSNGNTKEKWQIRKALDPQLRELWQESEVLRPDHKDRLDLCAPILKGGRSFLPLVRETFGLRCGLTIKFLRKEEPGKLIQRGDIDNRLKTLFDALSVPQHIEQIDATDMSISDPIYCVVEDDSLITSIDIDTQKLLSHPNASKNEVRLVIDVDVRVAKARNCSMPFFGD